MKSILLTLYLALITLVGSMGNLVLSTAASAADNDSYTFEGVLNHVDLNHGRIVIGDQEYAVAPNVPVSAGKDNHAASLTLKKGLTLKFTVHGYKDGKKPTVKQIWVIKAKSQREETRE